MVVAINQSTRIPPINLTRRRTVVPQPQIVGGTSAERQLLMQESIANTLTEANWGRPDNAATRAAIHAQARGLAHYWTVTTDTATSITDTISINIQNTGGTTAGNWIRLDQDDDWATSSATTSIIRSYRTHLANTGWWRIETGTGGAGGSGGTGAIHEFEFINDPVESRRHALRENLRPKQLNHLNKAIRNEYSDKLFQNVSQKEIVALQLLRKMVTEEQFRKYLKQGIVSVPAPSGLVYQIDRNKNIKVWERGECLATLCVHLQNRNIPPTDEVVAKMLMAEMDEASLWKKSNITWLSAKPRTHVQQLGIAV